MSVAGLVESVHHTAVCAQDFEATHSFFVNFLGFEVEGKALDRSEPELTAVVGLPDVKIRWALLRLGTHRVELFRYYTPTGKATPPAQCDTGFTHMAFAVSNVDEVHARAIASGYLPISSPQIMRGGVSRVFYLRGPENIIVEFMEFQEKGSV